MEKFNLYGSIGLMIAGLILLFADPGMASVTFFAVGWFGLLWTLDKPEPLDIWGWEE